MKQQFALVLALPTLWGSQSLAQSTAPVRDSDTDTELSKEIENPVTGGSGCRCAIIVDGLRRLK
jgi:hypothetical protein